MRLYLAPSRELAARRLKEGGPRIYDPVERWALAAFDRFLWVAAPLAGLTPRRDGRDGALDPARSRRVLALRLDRLGDLVMTLPALAELRKLVPEAEIALAVGSWNEELARGLPFVDRLRVVDLPSAAWGKRASWASAAAALRQEARPDLAIDFQGDIRSLLLMALTRPRLRTGYPDTGGGYLLTHAGRWDERKSWYRQSFELLRAVFPLAQIPEKIEPINFLLGEDREKAEVIFQQEKLRDLPRPLIGIHPSAGRAIKQWEVEKFAALAGRLAAESRGTAILTGSDSDRELVGAVAARARVPLRHLVGAGGVRTFAALLERLDLFVTGDSGPMHLAHSVATPTVALFGPSDPARYGPEGESPFRSVVRQPLYCSPCNMIRKPPRECTVPEAPECLSAIKVEQVVAVALRQLGLRRG